ncbi:NADPH-dependent FMN reductase [Secundilactobacillus collinoides]|uniref:NAD(P)H dehydrogenase n=2 Tax=Secundilactobacillus collinoides TaxID=33960 RepID=A0A0R2B6K5_SECCO|nr:NADPH-dependent FMN reductase [Secundilactobacillus collinoides]KRM74533.1 NAD(P)H dehydrogenase [Secundilactobacillus collinoides DSM 20515 = JCM 1123]
MLNIGVLVGSLSSRSYSQKIANWLMSNQTSVHFFQINYEILPLYNPDLEDNSILEWQVFRSVIDKMDALIFVTQEYNFSIPGGLKNAVDVMSVPVPQSHVTNKPAMVLTDSSGDRGGANANAHIQQLLRYMGMDVINNFITIGKVQALFNKENELINQELAKQLDDTLKQFVYYIQKRQNE